MRKLLLIFLCCAACPLFGAGTFDIRITNEFAKLIATNAELKKIASGMGFCEGPVWCGDYLLFSDIPANKLMRWSEMDHLSTFRTNTHSGNGNTLDREGRLLSCEGAARRIVRADEYGALTVVAESYKGKKFNAPNDVIVKSDHSIWFTDPDYGLPKGKRELPGLFVYCIDPTHRITPMAMDCDHPNGLCFSPDEKTLYVADSGAPHDIHAYDLRSDGTLSSGRQFCVIDKGVPDGIRCDQAGNIFSSAGDGIQIFNSKGELVGKILVPETPANLTFGGTDGHTLFITARTSLYSIPVLTTGVLQPTKKK